MKKVLGLTAALMLSCGLARAGEVNISISLPGVPPPAPVVMPWAPPAGQPAQHHYEYYPSAEVYFDPARALYFFMTGGVWRSGPKPPPTVVIQKTEIIKIDTNDGEPYKHHKDVRKHYPPGQAKKHGDDDHDRGRGNKGKGKGHDKDRN